MVKVPGRSSTTDKLLRTPFRSRTRMAQAATEADERRRRESELRLARLAERARPLEREPEVAPGQPDDEPSDSGELESQLDNATYQCGCGYVFQAAVVTSVDCPHCGDSQAW